MEVRSEKPAYTYPIVQYERNIVRLVKGRSIVLSVIDDDIGRLVPIKFSQTSAVGIGQPAIEFTPRFLEKEFAAISLASALRETRFK